MSIVAQLNPFDLFVDASGKPLDFGSIYIGEANKDPRLYPVQVYFDAALQIPAPSPLRTTNGFVYRNGSPTFVYINGNYSIMVLDSFGRLVFYVQDFLLSGNGGAVSSGDLSNTTDPTKGASLIPTTIRLVPNIAALRTMPKTGGSTQVFVQGYYAVGDAGGGNYYLDPSDTISADNGGTIIVATDGGRWKLKLGNTVSVRQFGAKGDFNGTTGTDDTSAFQNAYAAGLQRITVPAGAYLITSQVGSLTDGRGIVWLGDGGDDSQIYLKVTGGLIVNGKGWEVSGLSFKPVGIVPFAIRSGTIDDNHSSACHDNRVQSNTADDYFTVVFDFYSMWYSKVYNNYIYNGRVNTDYRGNGISFSYSVNNSVYGNTVAACSNAVICTATLNPVNGNVCEGIFLEDNILIANNTHFRAMAGLFFSIDANMLDLTPGAQNPVYTSDCSCVELTNNWISAGGPAILRYGDRHNISGNTFSGTGTGSLAAFESVRYSIFSGNNLAFGTQGVSWNAGGNGCSGWIMDGNQFTNLSIRAFDATNLTDSQVSNNRLNNVAAASLYSPTLYTSADEFTGSSVIAVTAGGISYTFSIALPANRFPAAPTVVELSVQSGAEPLLWTYNLASSTATSASFTVYPRSGALIGGNIRFGIFAKR